MKMIIKILAVLIIVPLLAGSGGVSLYWHYCFSCGEESVNLVDQSTQHEEYLNEAQTCSTSCTTCSLHKPKSQNDLVLQNKCCSDKKSHYKLDSYDKQAKKNQARIKVKVLPLIFSLIEMESIPELEPECFNDPPPILPEGKHRVYYLHKPKIPASGLLV